MFTHELLKTLRDLDVHLWVENQRLRYSAKPGVMTEEVLGLLKSHKSDIIQQLSTLPAFEPSTSESVPLSDAQRHVWMLEEFQAAPGACNLSFSIKLDRLVDRITMQQTLDEVVRRHSALRTTFAFDNDALLQTVHQSLRPEYSAIDLTGSGIENLGHLREHIALLEAKRSFDLQRNPVRATYIRVGPAESSLLVSVHHIVCDGWSLGILSQEIAHIRQRFEEGVPSELPPSTDYFQYIQKSSETQISRRTQAELAYWRTQLANLPRTALVDDDRSPFARGENAMPRVISAVLHGTRHRLAATCQRMRISTFMSILAAVGMTLFRHTGQSDSVIICPVWGRNSKEAESIVGCFVNTLAIRLRIVPSMSLLELLEHVRQVVLDAFDNQSVNFYEVWRQCGGVAAPQVQMPFGVMLGHQVASPQNARLLNNAIRPLTVGPKTDLSVGVLELEDDLHLSIEFNADAIRPVSIHRFIRDMGTFIRLIVDDETVSVAQANLLSREERHWLSLENRNSDSVSNDTARIEEVVLSQAKNRPDSIAVVCGDVHVSYQSLCNGAAALASKLQRAGVRSEDVVALYFNRSARLVSSILGVLISGGAFLPMDPTYPRERLEYMLQDSGARVGIAASDLVPFEAGSTDIRWLTDDWSGSNDQPRSSNRGNTTALAYVLYTSGSTGRPKGVMIPHVAVTEFLWAFARRVAWTAEERLLAISPISFDISLLELLLPLMFGGTVTIAPTGAAGDPYLLAGEIRLRQVTCMQATPATWRLLVNLEPQSIPPMAFCGGEALDRSLANLLLEQTTTLWNLYGPTEATIWSCAGRVRRGLSAPLIGTPLANTHVIAIDQFTNVAGVGAIGEFALGGASLARGYYKNPGLTADRFIPDFLSSMPGALIYRTGDWGRVLADASLQFLGRHDQQIKLRGHRIELGEIEAVLSLQHDVHEAIAVMRPDKSGVQQLIAFVTLRNPEAVPASASPSMATKPQSEAWSQSLTKSLPRYMVPQHYIALKRLPLTTSGKVDRNLLKAMPLSINAEVQDSKVVRPPTTATQVALANIWQAALDLTSVGIDQDFFELGGNSISAVMATSLAARQGMMFSVRDLFRYPTVTAMARFVVDAGDGDRTIPLEGVDQQHAEATLLPSQRWFFDRPFKDPENYNGAYLFVPDQPIEASIARQALTAVVAHHDALRHGFRVGDVGWERYERETQSCVHFKTYELDTLDGAEQDKCLISSSIEERRSLEFDGGLLKMVLIELQPRAESQNLLVIAHHLIVDGWSWPILFEDFSTACRQLSRGDSVSLAPATTTVAEWSRTLEAFARSAAVDEHLGYWLGLPWDQCEPLPRSQSGGSNSYHSISSEKIVFDQNRTTALTTGTVAVLGGQVGDVILSAVTAALCETMSGRPFIVDLTESGRDVVLDHKTRLDRTVGYLTYNCPIPLFVQPNASPQARMRSLLRQLPPTPICRLAFPVLRYLRADDVSLMLSNLPKPQVKFNFRGSLGGHGGPSGWRLATQAVPDVLDRSNLRLYDLNIESLVVDGRLIVEFRYSRNLHDPSVIKGWLQRTEELLNADAACCETFKKERASGPSMPLANFRPPGTSAADLTSASATTANDELIRRNARDILVDWRKS